LVSAACGSKRRSRGVLPAFVRATNFIIAGKSRYSQSNVKKYFFPYTFGL
jgi:hypothetical protein